MLPFNIFSNWKKQHICKIHWEQNWYCLASVIKCPTALLCQS